MTDRLFIFAAMIGCLGIFASMAKGDSLLLFLFILYTIGNLLVIILSTKD